MSSEWHPWHIIIFPPNQFAKLCWKKKFSQHLRMFGSSLFFLWSHGSLLGINLWRERWSWSGPPGDREPWRSYKHLQRPAVRSNTWGRMMDWCSAWTDGFWRRWIIFCDVLPPGNYPLMSFRDRWGKASGHLGPRKTTYQQVPIFISTWVFGCVTNTNKTFQLWWTHPVRITVLRHSPEL